MQDSSDNAHKSPLYLEDITVGLKFQTGTHRIDERQIVDFAGQFDPQPLHFSAKAAEESFFGGLVASGWHTAAITMRLMVTGGPPLAGGMIGVGGTVEWPRPTKPGDVLQVEGEVVSITPSKSHPDRGIVAIRTETKNQRGDAVQLMTAKLLMFRRSAKTA